MRRTKAQIEYSEEAVSVGNLPPVSPLKGITNSPEPTGIRGPLTSRAERVFLKLDLNKDGSLVKDEVCLRFLLK